MIWSKNTRESVGRVELEQRPGCQMNKRQRGEKGEMYRWTDTNRHKSKR